MFILKSIVETDSGHVELRDERDARITNIIADANMDGVRHLGNDDPYARLVSHEFRKKIYF